MATKRTDIHRAGAIVPADYQIALSYSLGNSNNPPFRTNCEREIVGYEKCADCTSDGCGNPHYHTPIYAKHAEGLGCCVTGLRLRGERFAEHGGNGHCTACGAAYIYGDVWRHTSGEHIHVGHMCAHKYGLLADRSAFELELGRRKQAQAVEVQRALSAEARGKILAENPGLAEALEVSHYIIADIRARFVRTLRISPAQIALVFKLANEIKNPAPPRPEERHVPAPEGRVTFKGSIVSAKWHEGDWGSALKVVVKVETPDGSWLAWGTAPARLLDETRDLDGGATDRVRGLTVELAGTLSPGRDKHFAFFKRPTLVGWSKP